jgi:hypothetical protein
LELSFPEAHGNTNKPGTGNMALVFLPVRETVRRKIPLRKFA